MEDVPSTYLSGQDDVDNLPYQLTSIGQNEACAPMPCPGGVEIVLVGGGEANVGAYPEEGGVLTSYPHLGYREDSREGIRVTHPRDSDGINCGIMGRPDQDRHLSSKYTLPPPDHRTLHHLGSHQADTHTTPWGYAASDAHEEVERESDGMSSEDQYRRYEWSSGLDDVEGHSQLMMIRSDPPPINMPAYRRALQLGRAHEAWQGGNYSEEDAHVEVEEEEEDGSVYPCIECNIYFKKKAHLLEHMFQHSQEGETEGVQATEGSHTCGECGKGFIDDESLETHQQLHQESRQKIIEEISKLENLADEGREARLQCPKCLFGTNSSKVFVQHAKTHVKKVSGETRGNPTSFRPSSDVLEGGETSEMANEGMWKSPEAEATAEQGWRSKLHQPGVQGPSKIKRKNLTREDSENSIPERLNTEGEIRKSKKPFRLPEAAVKLKRKFLEALRSAGRCEEDQRQQLRDQVAVVILKNIQAKKKTTSKGHQPLSYGKKLPAGNKGLLSRFEHRLASDDWGDEEEEEEDVPLDALLLDPKYASQLEALGLRSEERECPYCPDRFHNGIGLANHVRGHLNRVGVSYNVRHFISAEEVKAIEQNYSFQKKRKKVANFDPSTFSLMRCEFCGAGFDTRAGLSSHARAHLRDFGITNWELTVSPIHVLGRLLARSPGRPLPPFPPWHQDTDTDGLSDEDDGTPLDLGRPQISKADQGRVEKMASDQSGDKTDESKEEENHYRERTVKKEKATDIVTMEDGLKVSALSCQRKSPDSITCELCGACFETRKGLSSHTRSHLRHLGVLESESSGAPIDLLKVLAKHGKLPKDESLLGAKKVASPQPGSPKAQWGEEEDGPLNLTVEGESSRENDCQFCGAWFETRKGLSSHARAHLRHLGVTDPESKGHPITALNALIKSEEFKKRLSGHVPTNVDEGLTKASDEGASKDPATQESLVNSANVKEANIFTKMAEGIDKGNDDASSDASEGSPRSTPAESTVKLADSTGPIETSAHFKCPSGSGNSTQIKIVEAGAPHMLSSDVGHHTKLMEAGSPHVRPDTMRLHGKMETSNRPPLSGLAHPRPSPSHTPPTKKLKMSPSPCKPNMESYWSPKNVQSPLNLSPSSEEVRCEFCGEFFENRKGLSSHARSHLRQMGVTEWHVNGSPIDTLREILATGNCPRSANRIGGPNPDKLLSHHPPSSPSGSHPFSGLSQTMQRKPQHPTFTASEWPGDLSPLNLSSRADPTRDIRCEFCNEFFENRKGLSSHARSHLRQMGVTEWHVNGSPIDTLREIIRKRRPTPQPHLTTIKKEPRGDDEPHSPSQRLSPLGIGSQGMARDLSVSPHGRPHNNFLSPMPAKRPLSHGPRQHDPRGFVNMEPKTCNQSKSYMQGEPRPKSFMHEDDRAKTYIQSDGRPKTFLQSADGRPKTFIHDGRPKGFLTAEHRPKAFMHGDHKPKAFLQSDGRPKPYLTGDGKPKHFMHSESKPKVYSPDGKPKAYIQTELPFKVKVKTSPEKAVTSLEACCELCGLFFENRKALASHARAHLRQFGVTEWCVNGSPIETLREWMKQRPQKAGAYLSYIQGGRPYTKKFKRALQSPKPGGPERESPAVTPGKAVEAERVVGAAQVPAAEKPAEVVHGHKPERRHPKPAEVPPPRDETVSDHPSKAEDPRPPVRARPVPSLVPRPPQTSLVKFVGNIYTLKCRFCDIQFQGPLSIQEQWVRHLQHHILETNFSKASSPPHDLSAQEQQPEPPKAQ